MKAEGKFEWFSYRAGSWVRLVLTLAGLKLFSLTFHTCHGTTDDIHMHRVSVLPVVEMAGRLAAELELLQQVGIRLEPQADSPRALKPAVLMLDRIPQVFGGVGGAIGSIAQLTPMI